MAPPPSKMAIGEHKHRNLWEFLTCKAPDKFPGWQGRFWVSKSDSAKGLKSKIKWPVLFMMILLHLLAAVGIYKISMFVWQNIFSDWWLVMTVVFCQETLAWFAGNGVTMGAHRLWSHRSYEAHWILRLFLMCGFTLSFQTSIFSWARDHRVHHKKSETAGDPHDSTRGMFFAHMGWLLIEKRKEVKEVGRGIPVHDLLADPIVKVNHDYYLLIVGLITVYLPYKLGVYLTNDPVLAICYFVCYRIVQIYHRTWVINSVAHWHGRRHYLPDIAPADSTRASFFALGEGWHNFHHAFPEDYATAEYGVWHQLNPTKFTIDLMAFLGLAYNLRKAPKERVEALKKRVLKEAQNQK